MSFSLRNTIGSFILLFLAAAAWPSVGSAADLVAPGAKPVKLADGFKFTEGPAVAANGDVYFTDIPNNQIHKWSVADRKLSTICRGYQRGQRPILR